VPPPDGQKYAQYSFRVDNIQSFPDWVLVAYPCSSNKGFSKSGIVITSDATVPVAQGPYTCAIYAMKKDPWTAWRTANPAPTEPNTDDLALDALASSGQMLPCRDGPEPRSVVDESGPDTIEDTVHVQTLTDTNCQLTVDEQDEAPTSGCSLRPSAEISWRGSLWAAWCAALAIIARRRRNRRG